MEKKCRERSVELKLKCIMEHESGKSYSQIGRENGVHYTTVMKWCRMGKDKIFKERYAPEQEIVIALEDIMPRKVNVEDLMKELKAAKQEASYYKHKAAYHEALNQVLLEDAGKEAASKKKRYEAIKMAKIPNEKKNIRLLCAIADVTAKCYYHSLKEKLKEAEDARLVDEIRELQQRHFFSLGYRKVAAMLSALHGLKINAKRVRRLMREHNLLSRVRRKKYSEEVYATRRAVRKMKIPDLVSRQFFSSLPRRVFVQDITYLPCLEGMLYLNTIMDLFNAEIVAYAISRHPDTRLCLDSLQMLVDALGGNVKGIILHSDCGSTYTSNAYRARLKELDIRMSLGSKGSCYDNARMESLNGIIKTEALYCAFGKSKVNARRIPQAQVLEHVLQFVDYYNNERCKAALGMISPVQFRLRNPNGTQLMVLSEEQIKALDKTGCGNDNVLANKMLPSWEAEALRVQP